MGVPFLDGMFIIHGLLPPTTHEYNCSRLSDTVLENSGVQHQYLGIYFLVYGLISLVLYSLVVYGMCDRKMLKESCYKIMFCNCFVDMGNLLTSSVITGLLFMEASMFCKYPTITWIAGCSGLGFWCASCANCITLGLNRICVMTQTYTWLFKGVFTYMWIAFSIIIYLVAFFFTRPPLFNSVMGTWVYFPLISDIQQEMEVINNYFHAIVNISTAILLTVIYIFLITYVYLKKSDSDHGSKSSWESVQTELFIQAVAICFWTCFAAYVYIYMQFIAVPDWFYLAASIGYQFANTAPCFVYLTINKDIKNRIKVLLRLKKVKIATRTLNTVTIGSST